MAELSKTMRKLQLAKQYPDMVKELSAQELADIVLVVLDQVKVIEKAITGGQLDIGKELKKEVNRAVGEAQVSTKQVTEAVNAAIREYSSKADTTSQKLSKDVQDAILRLQERVDSLSDGKDGEVTEEEIERTAQVALSMLELPDFEAMVSEAITVDSNAIRDALELLQGEDRYNVEITDVKGLEQKLNELAQIRSQGGGGTSKLAVVRFVNDAIADGLIVVGGGSVSDEAYGGTWDGVTDEAPSKNAVYDKIQALSLGAGTGDVVGPVSAVDEQIAVFDGTTGKLLKDGGVAVSGLATASHTHTLSDVTDSGALAALDTVGTTEIDDNAVTFAKTQDIATNRILGRSTAGTGAIEALADADARTIMGLATTDSPQFAGVNVGHATDTTITRVSAGVIAVEGTNVSLAGHTHTASEVTDFDTEVANNSAVTANTAKLTCDTTNVTAAGALMDSEVTNLAQVKAFDTTDYATAAQGTTADSAVQPASTDTLTNKTIVDAKIQTTVNAQTGTTYTLVLTDASKYVTMSNASANTLTVPPNSSVAFAVGTRLMVQQLGAGATTIAAGAGVTINAPSTVPLAIGVQYESRGLLKTATDTWQLI